MDETIDKGLELKKGRDAANRNRRDIGRISVTGYDTKRPREHVESELEKIYASCGEITDVYIPIYRNALWHGAVIYFLGEGAVEKALQLNGTDMGGWTLYAVEYPFAPNADNFALIAVEGYDDTSLSKAEIKSELIKLFSSCGKVKQAVILEGYSSSTVYLVGENVAEKALKLNGAQIRGNKVLVELATHPDKSTFHNRDEVIISPLPEKSTSLSRKGCLITGRQNKKKAKLCKRKKKAKMTLE